jgi:hypothetical protein
MVTNIVPFPHSFDPAHKAITKSIRDGDHARQMRDRTRSARGYEKWNRAVFTAQDAHTAAWAEHHRIRGLWDGHFQRTYGETLPAGESHVPIQV